MFSLILMPGAKAEPSWVTLKNVSEKCPPSLAVKMQLTRPSTIAKDRLPIEEYIRYHNKIEVQTAAKIDPELPCSALWEAYVKYRIQVVLQIVEDVEKRKHDDTLGTHIRIGNKCDTVWYVALRYKRADGKWITGGFWKVKPGARIGVSAGEKRDAVRSNNNIFYVYAEEVDGRAVYQGSYSREEDRTYTIDGVDYRFARIQIDVDKSGFRVLNLKC